MVQYAGPQLDRVFHALADPTRRLILARLVQGPALVTEVAAPFAMSLTAVSKHLRVLEAAGLMRRRVQGREHHCAIEPAPLRGAAEWIAYYRRFWETRLDALDAFLTRPKPPTGSAHGRPARRRRR
jgi:DNA-binding transcriptional ArsR family regulator